MTRLDARIPVHHDCIAVGTASNPGVHRGHCLRLPSTPAETPNTDGPRADRP